MKKQTFYLSLFVISCILTFSCTTKNEKTNSFNESESSQRYYSEVLDSFVLAAKLKYKDHVKDSIWTDMQDFRASLIGVQFDATELMDVNQKKHNLNEIRTPMIVEITASWCAPCQGSVPTINKLARKFKENKSGVFILLLHDTGEAASEFSEKFDSNVIVVPSNSDLSPINIIKSKNGKFQNPFSFPTTLFLDKNLKIKQIRSGGIMAGTFPMGEDTLIYTLDDVDKFYTDLFNDGLKATDENIK